MSAISKMKSYAQLRVSIDYPKDLELKNYVGFYLKSMITENNSFLIFCQGTRT